MRIIAFVFARGGSKGLPGKNIRELGGVPLVGHSIRIARQVESIAQVYVSTDCEEIASVAMKYGAEVIWRPAELASDVASEWKAWQHAVQYLKEQGIDFDVFVSLPATSPLRSVVDVESCIRSLDEQTDIVVTVTPAARSPYFNMLVRDRDGGSHVVIQDKGIIRRQDAPAVFDMTTVAYVARPRYIMENAGLFAGTVKSVVIPKERAVDIDDEYDFQVAEAFYKCPL
ncbi:acylneuraminate cytidylyltransferase family protein [Pseudomonas caspiana]|uniref:acylneuraminate cytidylyltransferase family protein n=1 Tax=Pseudomonas caspiana TaxID=1451454 RepID=UPI0032EBDD76